MTTESHWTWNNIIQYNITLNMQQLNAGLLQHFLSGPWLHISLLYCAGESPLFSLPQHDTGSDSPNTTAWLYSGLFCRKYERTDAVLSNAYNDIYLPSWMPCHLLGKLCVSCRLAFLCKMYSRGDGVEEKLHWNKHSWLRWNRLWERLTETTQCCSDSLSHTVNVLGQRI